MRGSPFIFRFSSGIFVFITLLLYAEFAVLIGLSCLPGVFLIWSFFGWSVQDPLWFRVVGVSLLIGAGFFLYGLTLILLVPLVRWIFCLKSPPGRHSLYSLNAIRWSAYNALILLVRFTFMNFLKPTPLLNFFYRRMGARIGRRVYINTSIVADCNLLEIGDHTVIGGEATVIAHSGEGEELIVEPVKIGRRVTIGLNAIVMPGVTIGDGAIIAANSVVPKGKSIPPGTVWGGVPVRQIK